LNLNLDFEYELGESDFENNTENPGLNTPSKLTRKVSP
jgi:hypothetical protein